MRVSAQNTRQAITKATGASVHTTDKHNHISNEGSCPDLTVSLNKHYGPKVGGMERDWSMRMFKSYDDFLSQNFLQKSEPHESLSSLSEDLIQKKLESEEPRPSNTTNFEDEDLSTNKKTKFEQVGRRHCRTYKFVNASYRNCIIPV